MMLTRALLTAALVAALAMGTTGCGGEEVAKETSAPKAEDKPADIEDARAILQKFLAFGSDHQALTDGLRPDAIHYRRVLKGEGVASAVQFLTPHWEAGRVLVSPKPGQTTLTLWSATGSQLQNGGGDSAAFSQQLRDQAHNFHRDAVFVKFRFSEPGQELGMLYEGLVYSRGRWVLMPKLHLAFE